MTWGVHQGPLDNDEDEYRDALVPIRAAMLRGAVVVTGRLALFANGDVMQWVRPGAKTYATGIRNAVAIASDAGICEGHVALLKDGRGMKWGHRRRFPNGPVEVARVDQQTVRECGAIQ